jgi:hypothetical protein
MEIFPYAFHQKVLLCNKKGIRVILGHLGDLE